MTKKELIKDILTSSNIHHNIHIKNWSKIPDNIDWSYEAQFLEDDFVSNMECIDINDKGNRNLCSCDNKHDGKCNKHDIWHFYTYGRSSASLYWSKYWNETNTRGLYFNFDEEDLENMQVSELKTILKEINFFNDKIKELMEDFYAQCEYRSKEVEEEKQKEEKEEKEYQNIKKQVVERSFLKRLINEII